MSPETERIYHAFGNMRRAKMLFTGSASLPPGEFMLLSRVEQLGVEGRIAHVSELQTGWHITLSAVSQLIGQLERKGLVTRAVSPSDRRKVAVSLTPEGEALLKAAKNRSDEQLNALSIRFGEADTRALVTLLEKLGRVIDDMCREEGAQKEESHC